MRTYEARPREDHCRVDLNSDALFLGWPRS